MYLLIPLKVASVAISASFTSHYVSINSSILVSSSALASVFTSHYVSINSSCANDNGKCRSKFTSHYVSINSHVSFRISAVYINLHPTMYLLIRGTAHVCRLVIVFTSHYVSINSLVL